MLMFVLVLLTTANYPSVASGKEPLNIAVSIRPIHSIVANIMKGTGSPELIVKRSQSPHHANLKPSQAGILAKADLIFWVGPELETFLLKSIRSTAGQAASFRLLKLSRLQLRSSSTGQPDPHIWLSVENAITVAEFVTTTLSEANPASAEIYRDNLIQFRQEMAALHLELSSVLEARENQHFLVYHDALGYLEQKYKFHTQTINTGNEEITASARQIVAMGKLISSRRFVCLLVEPNINATAVISLARDNEIPVVTLDPLGSELPPGPGQYGQMMRNLAKTIADCSE